MIMEGEEKQACWGLVQSSIVYLNNTAFDLTGDRNGKDVSAC